MPVQRLTYEDVQGVYSIMPTPAVGDATDPNTEFTVDLEESRAGARALVEDGVDAIMINGTFGEAATLTDAEWRTFTQTVVETVNGDVPVLAGPTTLNTRETIERAEFARDIGAEGLLLGRPMWCQLSPEATLEFYQDVAEAVPELGIVLYYNPTAFKNEFDLSLWERIAAIPQMVGAKYITLDDSYRDIFDRVTGKLRMMTLEHEGFTAHQMFPDDATACWSGSASCDPAPVVALRNALDAGELEVENFVLGNGLDEGTQIGPQTTPEQAEKFETYLDIAVEEGATIHAQASLPEDPALAEGNFVPPTVLTDVEPDMRIAQEEVFGPVVGVMSFSDEEEATEIANDVPYGLSAALYTQDLNRAHRVASRIQAGIIGINHPSFALQGLSFGGYKRSGIGRKNDFEEAMHDFVQSKSIEIDMTDEGLSL